MNLNNCYNTNGNLVPELYYTERFGQLPNTFEFDFTNGNVLEGEKITEDIILNHFPSAEIIRVYCECDSFIEKNKTEEEMSNKITFILDNILVVVYWRYVNIYYKNEPIDKIKSLAKEVYGLFSIKDKEPKKATVSLIKCYQGDYFTSEKDINCVEINIDENYNDDFKSVYKDIENFLNEASSGIVLLHGGIGTGKTNFIRYLCTAIPKEYIIVPNSIANRLTDPDLVSFITDHTDSVFILEDCEQLLEAREDNPFNNAISTILNMADGLLSDICNIKFICTFNASISKIDPALLRKGRCAAKYEFKKLCAEKVAVLNEKYNLGHTEIKDMTLAEVYNSDKTDYSENNNDLKIGF